MSEHLFQAARFPPRPNFQTLLAEQPTPALTAKLGRTAGRLIVEFSARDTYWGARANVTRYIGANVLDRLWMELRHHAAAVDPRLPFAVYCDPDRRGALAQ